MNIDRTAKTLDHVTSILPILLVRSKMGQIDKRNSPYPETPK